MRLSVYTLAIGEYADCIERCLKSVIEADEVVVMAKEDTRTLDLAKTYTDKVYTDYTWCDDGGGARNHAVAKCTGDWILELDCDNWLEPGGVAKIRDTVSDTLLEVLSVTLKHSDTHYHKLPLLFRNGVGLKYVGQVHEILNIPAAADSGVTVMQGRSERHNIDPERNIRRLLQALTKSESPREMFYLGREYYDHGKYSEAKYWLHKYLTYDTWMPERAEAYYYMALTYWHTNCGDDAREACLRSIQINPDCRKALSLMSQMYYEPYKSKWERLARLATNADVIFVE